MTTFDRERVEAYVQELEAAVLTREINSPEGNKIANPVLELARAYTASRQELEAAQLNIAGLKQYTEWQSIDTANLDGTYLLVYPIGPGNESGSSAVAKYNGQEWAIGGSCGCNDNPIIPTHWVKTIPAPETGEV